MLKTLLTEGYSKMLASQNKLATIEAFFEKIILPKEVTKETLRKYIRRAINNKSWHKLPRERRALIKAATQAKISKIKNPTLKKIIHEIIIFIEKHSTKGKAIYYGIIITYNRFKTTTTKIETLLYYGINYLTNSPISKHITSL